VIRARARAFAALGNKMTAICDRPAQLKEEPTYEKARLIEKS